MDDLKLGRLLTEDRQRDAIHLAVIPVVAGERLDPGDKVGLIDGKAFCSETPVIGVVDPFLREFIEVGERFWLFLIPGSITSLRHDWGHPSFPPSMIWVEPGAKAAAERWLAKFAIDNYFEFHGMVEAALDGDAICASSDLDISAEEREEFWRQMEVYTGKPFDGKHRERAYFTCSC